MTRGRGWVLLRLPTHPKLDLHGVNLTYYLLSYFLLINTTYNLKSLFGGRSWRLRAVLILELPGPETGAILCGSVTRAEAYPNCLPGG